MEEIIALIKPVIHLFDGNGGDINTIIEKAMIFNTRNSFGRESLYTLNICEFKEALDVFIINKRGKEIQPPPYGMYT